MTNKSDEIRLEQFRCPHCHGMVKSLWNIETTGLVVCVAKCPEGRYAMKLEDCEVVDEVVEGEFLDEIEEEVG